MPLALMISDVPEDATTPAEAAAILTAARCLLGPAALIGRGSPPGDIRALARERDLCGSAHLCGCRRPCPRPLRGRLLGDRLEGEAREVQEDQARLALDEAGFANG
jgi:hypothetical protein